MAEVVTKTMRTGRESGRPVIRQPLDTFVISGARSNEGWLRADSLDVQREHIVIDNNRKKSV